MKNNYHWNIVHIIDDGAPYFFAKCIELEGCQTDAPTLSELEYNMDEVVEGYLELLNDQGVKAPLPFNDDEIKFSSSALVI